MKAVNLVAFACIRYNVKDYTIIYTICDQSTRDSKYLMMLHMCEYHTHIHLSFQCRIFGNRFNCNINVKSVCVISHLIPRIFNLDHTCYYYILPQIHNIKSQNLNAICPKYNSALLILS